MSSSSGSRFGRSLIRDGDDHKHINNFRPFLSHNSHSVAWVLSVSYMAPLLSDRCKWVLCRHLPLPLSADAFIKRSRRMVRFFRDKNSDMDLQKWPISELRVKVPSGAFRM